MQKQEKLKIIAIAAICLVAGIIIALIIILSGSGIQGSNNSASTNDGPGTELERPTAYFENRYQLDYSIGQRLSGLVLTHLEQTILASDAIAATPHANQPGSHTANTYISTIDETSFAKMLDMPEFTYRFTVNISDGRSYQVYVRTDAGLGEQYLATLIGSTLYIDSATTEYNESLQAWAEEITGAPVELIYTPDLTY